MTTAAVPPYGLRKAPRLAGDVIHGGRDVVGHSEVSPGCGLINGGVTEQNASGDVLRYTLLDGASEKGGQHDGRNMVCCCRQCAGKGVCTG